MESLIKKNLALLLGVLWICIALNFFLLPHSIASAGVGSIGYLIETGWSINRHIVVWGINLLMLALAFLLLKREVFVNTVIGSLAFPVLLALLPEIMLGSFFFSFGIFSLYKIGASNGGVTIPPLILEKYYGIRKSSGVFLTNLIIILLNLLIFSWQEALISAFSIYLIAFFMRFFMRIEQKTQAKKAVNVQETAELE